MRNSYNSKNKFDIISTLRGRLEYIKSVKGENSSAYLTLAKRYKVLNPNYNIDEKKYASRDLNEIIIYCEGKTDYKHIDAALKHFQKRGHYLGLKLDLKDKDIGGCDKLIKKLDNMRDTELLRKSVAIFDADAKDILRVYPKNTCEQISENLYVIVIPNPDNIDEKDPFCIEMLYKNEDLLRKDGNGRRIFLASEFNKKTGIHLKEPLVASKIGDKLIIDQSVYRTDAPPESNDSIALSKDDFAEMISRCSSNDEVDFDGFRRLLDCLWRISIGEL